MAPAGNTLDGQTILIIGGSSGIGFGVAVASLQACASTVIIASSSSSKVERAVERLQEHASEKQTVRGVIIDARDLSVIDRVIKGLGVINHLVFTSGDTVRGSQAANIGTIDIQSVKDAGIFDVRLWGGVQAAKSATFAPGGSIVLTGGALSTKPVPGWSLASASSAALTGLTRGLAADFAPSIRVNLVAPGFTDTELFDPFPSKTKQAMFELGKKSVLVQRIGKPEEIAEAYIFLMKCGFITGQVIPVDGGIF